MVNVIHANRQGGHRKNELVARQFDARRGLVVAKRISLGIAAPKEAFSTLAAGPALGNKPEV